MWPHPLKTILEPVFGPKRDLEEDEHRLVMVHRQRAGCGGIFILFWVGMWGFFLVTMGREVVREPTFGGGVAMLLMGGVAIAAAIYLIWTSFGSDELRVEDGWVRYSRRAIVKLRSRQMAVSEVEMIDLLGKGALYGDAAIVISGGGSSIHFGKGELPFMLVRFARKLRERVEKAAGRALPPALKLDEAENREKQRHQRVLEGALAAAGVQSAEEINDDAARQALIEKMAGLYVEELRPTPSRPRSRIERVGRAVFSWIAGIMVLGGGVVWIFATAVMTWRIFEAKNWGMAVFVLPLFWGTSVIFALALFASIKELVRLVVRVARGMFNHA